MTLGRWVVTVQLPSELDDDFSFDLPTFLTEQCRETAEAVGVVLISTSWTDMTKSWAWWDGECWESCDPEHADTAIYVLTWVGVKGG
jgi:hypothetical protein